MTLLINVSLSLFHNSSVPANGHGVVVRRATQRPRYTCSKKKEASNNCATVNSNNSNNNSNRCAAARSSEHTHTHTLTRQPVQNVQSVRHTISEMQQNARMNYIPMHLFWFCKPTTTTTNPTTLHTHSRQVSMLTAREKLLQLLWPTGCAVSLTAVKRNVGAQFDEQWAKSRLCFLLSFSYALHSTFSPLSLTLSFWLDQNFKKWQKDKFN